MHDGEDGDRVRKRLHQSHTEKQGKLARETICNDSLLKRYVN